MKRYKTFILLITSGFFLSCNKQLDLPLDGRITFNEVFNDLNNTRGYLNSCYTYLPAPGLDRASLTDEAQNANAVTGGNKFQRWYGGDVSSANFGTYSADGSPWGNLYTGIRKCNVFIKNIKTATVYSTEDMRAGWAAQAYTLRALYYLQLIKRYGSVPIFDEPLEIDHDFSKDKRSSFSEVAKFILADCDMALSYVNSQDGFSWNVYPNQYGIMTRAVAYAIKSQVATYAASPLWSDGNVTWADATRITSEALGQCLANDYKLFTKTAAPDIAQNPYALYHFTTSNDQRANDKETIYHRGGNVQAWKLAGLPSTSGQTTAGPCPTQELVDSYEMANGEAPITGYADAERLLPIINPASGYDANNPYLNRDPRFYASIYYNGAVRNLASPAGKLADTYVGGPDGISETLIKNTHTGYYLRKFNNNKSSSSNDIDGSIRLFRLAELYLNFAEAANQSVGPDVKVTSGSFNMTAREAVNAVRARAGMPDFPIGMTKEAFDKKYRNERKIELAFEEHRYFDVRRWKILEETGKFVTGMRITKTGTVLSYQRFKFNDRNSYSNKWLLYPVDQGEVNKIFGFSGSDWQNLGWSAGD